MLCRKCGNELKMGAKFCYSCGYYIDEDEDSIESAEEKKERTKELSEDSELLQVQNL